MFIPSFYCGQLDADGYGSVYVTPLARSYARVLVSVLDGKANGFMVFVEGQSGRPKDMTILPIRTDGVVL